MNCDNGPALARTQRRWVVWGCFLPVSLALLELLEQVAMAASPMEGGTTRTSLRSGRMTGSLQSLEKLAAPRPMPDWVMRRSGAKSGASASSVRSRGRLSVGSAMSRTANATAGRSSTAGLGHAPEIPVMEMGPTNVPIKFQGAKSHASVIQQPPKRDSVRPFPGTIRKPTLAKSASGVAIVYDSNALHQSSSTGASSNAALDTTVAAAIAPPSAADREAALSLVLDLLGDDAETDSEVR